MFKFAKKPLNTPDLIKDYFKLFSDTMGQVWQWSFLLAFLSSLPNILHILWMSNDVSPNMSISILDVLLVFVLLGVSAYFITVIMHRIYALVVHPKLGAKDSLIIAKAKWPIVFIAMLLVALAMLAGFMALIIPGIFLAVLLIFYLPFILFDNLPALESIKQSAIFVWGYWWQTLIVVAIPSLIGLALLLFTRALMQNDNLLGFSLAKMVITALFTPLLYSAILVQFNNIKRLRGQTGF